LLYRVPRKVATVILIYITRDFLPARDLS